MLCPQCTDPLYNHLFSEWLSCTQLARLRQIHISEIAETFVGRKQTIVWSAGRTRQPAVRSKVRERFRIQLKEDEADSDRVYLMRKHEIAHESLMFHVSYCWASWVLKLSWILRFEEFAPTQLRNRVYESPIGPSHEVSWVSLNWSSRSSCLRNCLLSFSARLGDREHPYTISSDPRKTPKNIHISMILGPILNTSCVLGVYLTLKPIDQVSWTSSIKILISWIEKSPFGCFEQGFFLDEVGYAGGGLTSWQGILGNCLGFDMTCLSLWGAWVLGLANLDFSTPRTVQRYPSKTLLWSFGVDLTLHLRGTCIRLITRARQSRIYSSPHPFLGHQDPETDRRRQGRPSLLFFFDRQIHLQISYLNKDMRYSLATGERIHENLESICIKEYTFSTFICRSWPVSIMQNSYSRRAEKGSEVCNRHSASSKCKRDGSWEYQTIIHVFVPKYDEKVLVIRCMQNITMAWVALIYNLRCFNSHVRQTS